MMGLLLLLHHHRLSSSRPYHLPRTSEKPTIVSLSLEEHGRPRLHAMGAHPCTAEYR